jgi:hypothetical protein
MSRTVYDVSPRKLAKKLGMSPLQGKFGGGLDEDIDPVRQAGKAEPEEGEGPEEQSGKEANRRAEDRDDPMEEAAEGEVPHPPPSSSGALPDDEEGEEAEGEGLPGKPTDGEEGELEDQPTEEMDYDDDVLDVDEDLDAYDADDDEEEWDEEGDEEEEAAEGLTDDRGGVPVDEGGYKEWPPLKPPPRPGGVQQDVLQVWSDRRKARRKA